jgi:hypothetical protein
MENKVKSETDKEGIKHVLQVISQIPATAFTEHEPKSQKGCKGLSCDHMVA